MSSAAAAAAPTWLGAAREMDELLFKPSYWRALGPDNQQPAGVDLPSLEAGLVLAADPAASRVTSVFGYVRDDVVAVDIDVAPHHGDAGNMLVRRICEWLRREGVWHVARPSGGGPGRHHVFAVPGGRRSEFLAYVAGVRRERGVPSKAKAIDVRQPMRPLSAPHRSGRLTRPIGDLERAVARLRRLRAQPASNEQTAGKAALKPITPRRARDKQSPPRPPGGAADVDLVEVPLHEVPVPFPRRPDGTRRYPDGPARPYAAPVSVRRRLPLPWVRYLAGGQEPDIGGTDSTSSAVGLRLTAALVSAGYTAAEAWREICSAHPDAAAHARGKADQNWWIKYQWNLQVSEYLEYHRAAPVGRRTPAPGPIPDSSEDANPAVAVQDAIEAACHVLHTQMWALYGHRERQQVLDVADWIVEQVARAQTLEIPCPLRNLEQDLAISRKTAIKSLRLLDGVLGDYQATFDPANPETSSHTFRLRESQAPYSPGVGQLPPPVPHTPPGQAPAWPLLGRPAHVLWRRLDTSQPRDTTELARLAGRTTTPHAEPTPDQVRCLRRHLKELARAGLASCDDTGRWTRRDSPTAEYVDQASRAQAEIDRRIERERHEYRAAPAYQWRREQREALERERQKAIERYHAWRAALSPDEQRQRAMAHAGRFAALPLHQQAEEKHLYAERRQHLGLETEAERHDRWCASLTRDEYGERAAHRAAAYRRLSKPERAAHAAAWAAHRHRWKVPVGPPDDSRRSAPATVTQLSVARSIEPLDTGQLELALETPA